MTRAKDKTQDLIPEAGALAEVVEAAPAEAPAPAPAAKGGWPKFLKSMTAFGYTDPETNIHYGPVVAMKIEAAPKDNSWMHSQMKANLIGEA
jgi:hypothetical protein